MKSISRVLWMLFCFSFLNANEEENFIKAKSFLEAGDEVKALKIYKELIDAKEPWKNALLHYNMGTVHLRENDFRSALRDFEMITLGENPFSFFLNDLWQNWSIANWRFGNHLLKAHEENIENYFQSFAFFNEALEKLSKINFLNSSLLSLKESIEKKIVLTKLNYQRQQLRKIPIEEALSFIYFNNESIKNTLLKLDFDNPLTFEQLKKVNEEFKSWKPVWLEILSKNNELDFLYKNYLSIIDALKNKDSKKGIEFIDQLEEHLKEVIDHYLKDFRLNDLFSVLNNIYKSFLNASMISLEKIKTIFFFQTKMSPFLNDEEKRILELSQSYIIKALKNFEFNDLLKSKFFLILGYKQLKYLERIFFDKSEFSLSKFLEVLIEQQTLNLEITTLAYRSKNFKLKEIAKDSQKFTDSLSQNFWSLSSNYQKESYKKGACLYFPWNQLIPTFIKGSEHANQAYHLINELKPLSKIINSQSQAIRFWKKSLNLLNDKSEKAKNCPQVKNEENESMKNNSMDETLRLLQQMEQDDRQERGQNKSIQEATENLW